MGALIEHLQKKKRIRYKIPTYKKVYSTYVYDQKKYSEIFLKIQRLALKYGEHIFTQAERYKVLKQCYVRQNGELQPLGDEKHIFRYKVLHKVLSEIANVLFEKYELLPEYDVCSYLYKRTGIAFFCR